MRVLVTGHLGYIGTVMVPMLLNAGHEVVGLDTDLYERCTFPAGGEIAEVPHVHKDVRDVDVRDLDGIEAIIHLAALSNDPLGSFRPEITYEINYRASVRLAGLAKRAGVRRFLLASSCSNYGQSDDSMLDESGALNPVTVEMAAFKDGYFPYQGAEIKDWFEALRSKVRTPPDVILSHSRNDAHQDHREVSRLTWNTFRNHLILEYEIPKWDGDLGQPNVYVPASKVSMDRKIEILLERFGSQRSKDWFTSETFMALARLRGNECRAPDGLAEAFNVRKLILR